LSANISSRPHATEECIDDWIPSWSTSWWQLAALFRILVLRSNKDCHHIRHEIFEPCDRHDEVRTSLMGTMRPTIRTVGGRGAVSRGIAVNLATSMHWDNTKLVFRRAVGTLKDLIGAILSGYDIGHRIAEAREALKCIRPNRAQFDRFAVT